MPPTDGSGSQPGRSFAPTAVLKEICRYRKQVVQWRIDWGDDVAWAVIGWWEGPSIHGRNCKYSSFLPARLTATLFSIRPTVTSAVSPELDSASIHPMRELLIHGNMLLITSGLNKARKAYNCYQYIIYIDIRS